MVEVTPSEKLEIAIESCAEYKMHNKDKILKIYELSHKINDSTFESILGDVFSYGEYRSIEFILTYIIYNLKANL